MWIIAGIGSCILVLLFYIYFSKITISIQLNLRKNLHHADIQLKVFNGLYRKKFSIPLFEREGTAIVYSEQTNTETDAEKLFSIQDMNQAKEVYDRFLQQFKHVKKHTKDLLKKVKVEKLATDVKIGLEEADWTAYLTSGIWVLNSWIILVLSPIFQFKCKPQQSVQPLYGVNAFALYLSCIASIRLGHLMIIGVRFWLDRGLPKHKKVGEVHGAPY
ncbi:hypothetical protein [Jeotgalibacillus proteolyticus]|uniref:hypothetical protein n=1 Tax=Jeotgalibacillus proteolyticus TaxID=2082395 RepID=UPI003CEDC5A1